MGSGWVLKSIEISKIKEKTLKLQSHAQFFFYVKSMVTDDGDRQWTSAGDKICAHCAFLHPCITLLDSKQRKERINETVEPVI
jgi:hypothetical protein